MKRVGRKGESAASPPETHTSALGRPAFSATDGVGEDVLVRWVHGREAMFKARRPFAVSEKIL